MGRALAAIGVALAVHAALAIGQLGGRLPADPRWLRRDALTSQWQRELARASVARIRATTRLWLAGSEEALARFPQESGLAALVAANPRLRGPYERWQGAMRRLLDLASATDEAARREARRAAEEAEKALGELHDELERE